VSHFWGSLQLAWAVLGRPLGAEHGARTTAVSPEATNTHLGHYRQWLVQRVQPFFTLGGSGRLPQSAALRPADSNAWRRQIPSSCSPPCARPPAAAFRFANSGSIPHKRHFFGPFLGWIWVRLHQKPVRFHRFKMLSPLFALDL